MKFGNNIVYENISYEISIGYGATRVKVTARSLKRVLHFVLPQGTVALIHNGKMKLRLVVQ